LCVGDPYGIDSPDEFEEHHVRLLNNFGKGKDNQLFYF
jgi:hypothetical protein